MSADFIPGDQVVCKILYGEIVGRKAKDYDFEQKFEIIVSDFEGGYLLYVPDDVILKDSIYISKENYAWYQLDKKYIDSYIVHILDRNIVRCNFRASGMCCKKCGEHSAWAEANIGIDFVCWLCRSDPYR